MIRNIVCLTWASLCLALLALAAPAYSATMYSAGDFSATGISVTDGGMTLDSYGGALVWFLEYDPLDPSEDHLTWTHSVALPSDHSVTSALLTITFADDPATDVMPWGDDPEIGYGTIEGGVALFGDGVQSFLLPGAREFVIDPAHLADGMLSVTVRNNYGDAFVTGASLQVLAEQNPPQPSPVPLPGAGLLLLGAGVGLLGRRLFA